MSNGLRLFRLRKGLSAADLARRAGTTRQQVGKLENGKRKLTRQWAEHLAPHLGCTAQELLFPEKTQIDLDRFHNVFDIADSESERTEPRLCINPNLIAQLIPQAADHRLKIMMVDSDDVSHHASKGDAIIIDIDDIHPSRPGLYVIDIAGVPQWRFLSPTTSGMVQVIADGSQMPAETVRPTDIKVIGRARLKLSTI